MVEITIAAIHHRIIALRLPARCVYNVMVMGDVIVAVEKDGITDPMEMATNVSIVAVVQVQVLAAGVVAQGIDNSNTSIILSSRNVHFYTKIARFCSVYCGSARLFTNLHIYICSFWGHQGYLFF